MKKVNIGLLLGAAVLTMVAITIFTISGAAGSAGQYGTFSQAKTTGEEVHVAGTWVLQERASYDSDRDMFDFFMQDTAKTISPVRYYDPMPANFKSAERIVVQGKYEGAHFVAERILMKCPSKYNSGDQELQTASSVREEL